MNFRNKLFDYPLKKNSDFIEIGGGEGDLCTELVQSGIKFILYAEPDKGKFDVARKKLYFINCQNIDISKIDFSKLNKESDSVTIIMQDVIEHISKDKLKYFFNKLSDNYSNIYFIGRTPNLKSPFGLRNSFGDNSHIYRFTNSSLNHFLKELGFINIVISYEPYKISGLVSFVRYLPYFITIFSFSLMFMFVYGSWEGFLTPNLVFHAKKY